MDHGYPHWPEREELGRKSGAVLHLHSLCHPDCGHPPDHGGPLGLPPRTAATLVRGGPAGGWAEACVLSYTEGSFAPVQNPQTRRCLLSHDYTQGPVLVASVRKCTQIRIAHFSQPAGSILGGVVKFPLSAFSILQFS